jgi:hypothetical protein
VGVVLGCLVMGAVVGAGWFAIVHWSTRGRRDFSSIPALEADSYEVVVESSAYPEAAHVLGVTNTRSIDPRPSATDA